MKTFAKFVAGAISAIIIIALASAYIGDGGYGVADADDAAQVARGAEVHEQLCAECHGANLKGQINWQKPLPDGGYPAPPQDGTGHTWHHSDRWLVDYIREGGEGKMPGGVQSNMPPFGEVLSNDDMWAVVAFLKNRWPSQIRRRQAQINQAAEDKRWFPKWF